MACSRVDLYYSSGGALSASYYNCGDRTPTTINVRGGTANAYYKQIIVSTDPGYPLTTYTGTASAGGARIPGFIYNDPVVPYAEELDTGFVQGLLASMYSGYFSDNVNFFSTATLLASSVKVAPFGLYSGNPGTNFSQQFLGYFIPTTTETYTFYTNSDDASYLWIGGNALTGYTTSNALVNNGGIHGMVEVSGSIKLKANTYYPIRIQYGQGGGGLGLTINYSTPTISKNQLLPVVCKPHTGL